MIHTLAARDLTTGQIRYRILKRCREFHRRPHPLVQRPRRAEEPPRTQVAHPAVDRVPGQGCVAEPSDGDLRGTHMGPTRGYGLIDGERIRGSDHQGTTPLSSKSWPVGPSSGRVASRMAIAAPCSGVWVPLNPLRSVAT
ncbi:hypothetical protein SANTM175S_09952 [Streptomyces antimycoticus]